MTVNSTARRLLVVALVGFLAVAVFYLAWPRLLSSFRYLPVKIAIDRYFATREIPSDRLTVLIGFANEAIAHQDHYLYHNGLSLLQLLRAVDLNTPALQRRDAYLYAEKEAVTSLASAPAQPELWLRVATIRSILHEEPSTILAAWKMSIFTGRTSASLMTNRLALGMTLWGNMDPEATAMFRDQLLLAWRMQPGSVIRVLADYDGELSVTRQLIEVSDPLALEEMEAWLAKLH